MEGLQPFNKYPVSPMSVNVQNVMTKVIKKINFFIYFEALQRLVMRIQCMKTRLNSNFEKFISIKITIYVIEIQLNITYFPIV